MPASVCKFFLQGNCKFGDKCWHKHTRPQQTPATQGQAWGLSPQSSRDGSSFRSSYSGGQNPYRWSANDTPNQQKATVQTVQHASAADIVKSLLDEVGTWEKSKMWPFSCYGFEKEGQCIPGLSDCSQEELRLEAYEAKNSGNTQQYISRVQQLLQDITAKKQELKHPSPQTKQQLLAFIEDCRNKGSASAAGAASTGTGTSVFGNKSGSTFGTTQPSTNNNPFNSQSSGSVFGGSADIKKPSVFGASAQPTKSAFGSQPSGSVFGTKPAENTFTNQTSGSVFGIGSKSTTSASVFGSKPSSTNNAYAGVQPAGASVFGAKPTSESVFGAKPTSESVFGIKASSNTNAFGSGESSFSGMQTNSSVFGQKPTQQPQSIGSGNNSPFTTGNVNSNAFNQMQTPKTQTGAFSQMTSAPGQSSASSSIFGSGQATATPTSQISLSANETKTQTCSGVYTPLADLTPEERQQFEAPKFTLGKIPMRPPPKELVH